MGTGQLEQVIMDEIEADKIETSGRESETLMNRAGLLQQDVMWLRNGHAPIWFKGIDKPAAAAVHDFNGLTAWADNHVALIQRKTSFFNVDNVSYSQNMRNLSLAECCIMAWKRGGHEEYKRVRDEQRKRGIR